ncbi:glycosyltransferase family 2 protein [Morganella morganii subsp. morganii]|uniref:glycosyltransferase family 2 protein n=2 Tax=Enterobacterales TaxID=91347 RepID=UPI001BD9E3A8|nr:glycosyltransferase family 2 protein [Morganella morganii]MBT0346291.1 glycosyltransferase family 2 protein [Morganella morganii subsp. morganii]
MENKYLVSYCIPMYNASAFISDCINSILNQTYENIEIIIVDDGSTDNSYDLVLQTYEKNNTVKLFKNNKNLGVSKTLNKAISLSSGYFIARMDADDLCTPYRTQKQVEMLLETNSDICIGDVEYFGQGNNRVWNSLKKNDDIKKALLFNCPISHPTVMFKKERIALLNFYNEDSSTEDYNLWVKCIKNNFSFCAINDIAILSRIHSGSVTQRKKKIILDSAQTDRLFALLNNDILPNKKHAPILSRGLSGSNKLTLNEFKLFIKLHDNCIEKISPLSQELRAFIIHNWVSIGINNTNLGLFAYYFWSKSYSYKEIPLAIKFKLFICYAFCLDSSSNIYHKLKKIFSR